MDLPLTGGWIRARSERVLGNSVGLIVTVGVHVVALVLLLANQVETNVEPRPLMTRIIGVDKQEQVVREPIRAEPTLDRPRINVPQPEVILADTTPSPRAPVAVASAPAPSRSSEPQQQVESLPRFDADYLNNPAPAYPSLSRRLREQGLVLLRVHVMQNGLAETVELQRSSGSERLDISAITAVRKWKFVPARRAGSPVDAWVVVPIEFSLDGIAAR